MHRNLKIRLSLFVCGLLSVINAYGQTTPGDSIKPKMLNNSINLSIGPGGIVILYVPA
ncbi:MAG: hypothetical protein ACKO4Y_06270 [Flavobacteriales bacterium]